jgi:hypothetical protein
VNLSGAVAGECPKTALRRVGGGGELTESPSGNPTAPLRRTLLSTDASLSVCAKAAANNIPDAICEARDYWVEQLPRPILQLTVML